MWTFYDISATQILRETNFGHIEASKTAICAISVAIDFDILRIFDISKCEIHKKSKFKAAKWLKWLLLHIIIPKIDFT